MNLIDPDTGVIMMIPDECIAKEGCNTYQKELLDKVKNSNTSIIELPRCAGKPSEALAALEDVQFAISQPEKYPDLVKKSLMRYRSLLMCNDVPQGFDRNWDKHFYAEFKDGELVASYNRLSYVTVPIEPTDEMLARGRDVNDQYAKEPAPCSAFKAISVYKAMISAAPKPTGE